jgi:uroporphyrinogen-III synthase
MFPPLKGRRIVVTRSPRQAEAFCTRLSELGAYPIRFPTIQFVPLPTEQLDAALNKLDAYDWLIFTSGNAVSFFLARLEALQQPISHLKVAASGAATAQLLQKKGVSVDFVPDEFVGERLVAGLGDLVAQRVLLPRAKIGRPQIVKLLQAQGAIVEEIPLYDTITADPPATAWAELDQGVDVITFTSPSSVRNFFKILDMTKRPVSATGAPVKNRLFAEAIIACIGPITADAVREQGVAVSIMPEEYTIDGLVTAVVDYFKSE